MTPSARGGIRTHKARGPGGFKPPASSSSATRAQRATVPVGAVDGLRPVPDNNVIISLEPDSRDQADRLHAALGSAVGRQWA